MQTAKTIKHQSKNKLGMIKRTMQTAVQFDDWRWFFVTASVILGLTFIPIYVGYLAQTPAQNFAGVVYDRQDFEVHKATMVQGAQGHLTYRFMFSTEQGSEIAVKGFYLLLGRLTGAMRLEPTFAYHAARLLFGLLALVMIFRFLTAVFPEIPARRASFLLAATGSGFGWIMLVFNWQPTAQISPIDFWLIDLYEFFSLVTFPHFSAVILLILIIIMAFDHFLTDRRLAHWILAATASLGLIAFHPFSIIIADLAVAGVALGHWRANRRLDRGIVISGLLLLMIQLPLIIYNDLAFSSDQYWEQFRVQMVLLSPPPVYYLLGLGVLGPLAVLGIRHVWIERDRLGIMAATWVVGVFGLVYIPTLLQRRFTAHLTIPLALLAVMGVRSLFLQIPDDQTEQAGPFLRKWIFPLLVGLALPSSMYLIAAGSAYVIQRPEELFDPSPVIEAVDWLGEHADIDQAVLSSPRTGLIIPGRTGLRVYIGHQMETLYYNQKTDKVNLFFNKEGMSTQERQAFLETCGCSWIIHGPFERAENGGLQLQALTELHLAFENEEVQIFRVDLSSGDGGP